MTSLYLRRVASRALSTETYIEIFANFFFKTDKLAIEGESEFIMVGHITAISKAARKNIYIHLAEHSLTYIYSGVSV